MGQTLISIQLRSIVLAGAFLAGSIEQAHAVIDLGVSTVFASSSPSSIGPGGPGVADAATGLTWAMSSDLSEAAAAGFRPATSAEFQTLIEDTGLERTAGVGLQYQQQLAIPAVQFGRMVVGQAYFHDFGGRTDSYGVMGILDGGVGGQVGVLSDSRTEVSGSCRTCPTTSIIHRSRALLGGLDALTAGVYDQDWKWSQVTKDSGEIPLVVNGVTYYNYAEPRLASNLYFLVREVPEPATWALMGLGLLAVGWGQKRTQRSS